MVSKLLKIMVVKLFKFFIFRLCAGVHEARKHRQNVPTTFVLLKKHFPTRNRTQDRFFACQKPDCLSEEVEVTIYFRRSELAIIGARIYFWRLQHSIID
jgi:hypothetical protein